MKKWLSLVCATLFLVMGVLFFSFTAWAQPSGAVASWRLDENGGCTAYDETVNNNHGTLMPDCSTNSPIWTLGLSGSALGFDGIDDYVDAGNDATLNPGFASGGWTVEAWVNIDATGGKARYIVQKMHPDEFHKGFLLAIRANGSPSFWTRDGSPPNQYRARARSSASVDDGAWHHIVGVVPTSGNVKVYVDAIKTEGDPRGGDLSVSENLQLGHNPEHDNYFPGLIDEVVVYDQALTDEEIASRYGAWLRSTIAYDASDEGDGIQDGDQVVITFSYKTEGNPITSANIDSALALSGSCTTCTWLDGSGNIGGATWSASTYPNDTLTITLSTNGGAPDVLVGDTITLDGTITDNSGDPIIDSMTITGSFGYPPDAVASWRLNENAGCTAYDDTVNNNHGTLMPDCPSDSPIWSPGLGSGSALSFDGIDDYVDAGNDATLNPGFASGGWTVEAWVNIDATGGAPRYIVEKMHPKQFHKGFLLAVRPNGTPAFWTRDGSNRARARSAVSVDDGAWHHIVGVVPTSGNVKIYVDGTETEEDPKVGNLNVSESLHIGHNPEHDNYFPGLIDKVVIYDQALTCEQIKTRCELFGGSCASCP